MIIFTESNKFTCSECGYILAAHEEPDMCPQCGTDYKWCINCVHKLGEITVCVACDMHHTKINYERKV